MEAEIQTPSDLGRRLDGRTNNSKMFDAIVATTTASIGGNPTAHQKRLIDSYAAICVHLDALNLRLLQGDDDIPQGQVTAAIGIMMRLGEALYGKQHVGDANEQPVLHP